MLTLWGVVLIGSAVLYPHLMSSLVPSDYSVTGSDSDKVANLDKLPLVLAVVLTLSFLYLLLIFRSVLIPAKAVVMNLLATAAAFGLTVWVFQEGHLEGLFGFTSVGFVQVYLPIMVFAVLFGLSMDYEVFLIRRIQEHWVATGDNDEAVVVGIAHTARPIVARPRSWRRSSAASCSPTCSS